jgi:hypothetical protein
MLDPRTFLQTWFDRARNAGSRMPLAHKLIAKFTPVASAQNFFPGEGIDDNTIDRP